jgi:DNA-binding response OmpR family regulator
MGQVAKMVARNFGYGAGMHVLCVDDYPGAQRLMQRIIGHVDPGITFSGATTAELALEAVQEKAPDFVMLDLNLPDMRGEDLMVRLHELPGLETVPVAILSADMNPMRRARVLDWGAIAFLLKPYDIDELIVLLNRYRVNGEGPESKARRDDADDPMSAGPSPMCRHPNGGNGSTG